MRAIQHADPGKLCPLRCEKADLPHDPRRLVGCGLCMEIERLSAFGPDGAELLVQALPIFSDERVRGS